MVVSTGIIHTGIVYLLFFDSLRFLSTKFISIIVFLETVFTGFRPDLFSNTRHRNDLCGYGFDACQEAGEGSCFCFISKRSQAEQEMNLKK